MCSIMRKEFEKVHLAYWFPQCLFPHFPSVQGAGGGGQVLDEDGQGDVGPRVIGFIVHDGEILAWQMICAAGLLEGEVGEDMEKNHADSHLDKIMNSVTGRLYYGNSSLILVYNWFSFFLVSACHSRSWENIPDSWEEIGWVLTEHEWGCIPELSSPTCLEIVIHFHVFCI